MLKLVKIGIEPIDIISESSWAENLTAKWNHVSIASNQMQLDDLYGFKIVLPGLEELGEAENEVDSTISIDNLTIEFTLPCNFDELSEIG